MNVRTYIIILMGGLAVGALGMFAGISYVAKQVEGKAQSHSQMSLLVSDVKRFSESFSQWLLVSDLILGSDETYLIESANNQRAILQEILTGLRHSISFQTINEEVGALDEFIERQGKRLNNAGTYINDDRQQKINRMLDQMDQESPPVIDALESMQTNLKLAAENQYSELMKVQERRTHISFFLIAAYIAYVFVLWRWIVFVINRPLQRLTHATQIALRDDCKLRFHPSGPLEIHRLAESFKKLVHNLEDRVNERTENLFQLNKSIESTNHRLQETNASLQQEMADRQKAEKEREALQDELIASSRLAGMAEIANGVLHNVGNILNSVNVSSLLVAENIAAIKIDLLEKASNILEQNENRLGEYFETDERAKHLPKFIRSMVTHIKDVQAKTISESEALNKNIGFIKEIVQAQQSFAGKSGGVMTTVRSDEIFEDALRFVHNSFERHAIKVEKNYDFVVEFEVDKSKLLQILTNFIKNAREAVGNVDKQEKKVRLSISKSEFGNVLFSVTDNGIGVSEEILAQVFTHGFTTKPDGHGFGLHSSAIAAKEMNGAVRVESQGIGKGATFHVELPLSPTTKTIVSPLNDAAIQMPQMGIPD